MSKNNYHRLTSDNVSEFEWTKTTDGQIIVRDKDNGEILILLDRPLDQKSLIADSYQAGLQTAYKLSERYIEFLEKLTAPMMPDYIEPELPYQDEYIPMDPASVFISDDEAEVTAKNYVYEIMLPHDLVDIIVEINARMKIAYDEVFFAQACSVWIENVTRLTDTDVFAAPYDGVICRVFINNKDQKNYLWLSEQTHHRMIDLIYTAIREMAKHMKDFKPDDKIVDISEAHKIKVPKASQKLKMRTICAVPN